MMKTGFRRDGLSFPQLLAVFQGFGKRCGIMNNESSGGKAANLMPRLKRRKHYHLRRAVSEQLPLFDQ
jgi:hypothetical protein